MASIPSDKPWQSTQLYQRLVSLEKKRDRSATELLKNLDTWLPEAHTILRSAGNPRDYSLHDDQHAYRVAERMWAIISGPARLNLSPLELSFLLLAAYLHDIGMSPAADRLRHHHDWLCYGETGGPHLTPEEVKEFRTYLDEHHSALPIPFPRTHPEHDERARRILSAYAREQHNAWSAAWMREEKHLPEHALYHGWREDLIHLCASHHWDIEVVRRAPELSARAVSHHGESQPLDLRYLACLLRAADILENDPERTPPILYAHRDIIPSSQLYWQRDHFLTVEVGGNTNREGLLDIRVRCQPHCPAAVIEKAARDLCDAISSELEGCDYLAAQPDSAFGRIPGMKELDRPWQLPRRAAFFEPQSRPYEYIDGTFRPDTQALLKLVAGESLYGTPLAAVRELLQNAFDAVREKIARRRLALSPEQNPADPKWEEEFGNHERVTLRLERRPDPLAPPGSPERLYLICEDTGTGMTRDIITGRLLHSGRPPGHTHKDLESQCKEKGFTMGRTARFGIGALSYFMLADEVTITTRRDQLCNDAERDVVWQFTTTGTGEFGELKRLQAKDHQPGTRVAWRITKKFAEDSFAEHLVNYIIRVVLLTPCPFLCETGEFEDWHLRHGRQPLASSNYYKANRTTRAADMAQLPWEFPKDLREKVLGHVPNEIPNLLLESGLDKFTNFAAQHLRIRELTACRVGLASIRVAVAWLELEGIHSMMWSSDPYESNAFSLLPMKLRSRIQSDIISIQGYGQHTLSGMAAEFFAAELPKPISEIPSRQFIVREAWACSVNLEGNWSCDVDLILEEDCVNVDRHEVNLPAKIGQQLDQLANDTARRLAWQVMEEFPGTHLERELRHALGKT